MAVTPNRQIVLEWEANEGALSDGDDAVMALKAYLEHGINLREGMFT